MTRTIRTIKNNRGFTLIEIMIALVIFGLISTAIYATYQSQQSAYLEQEQVVEIQQNIRAAMYLMERDIRMMSYDPTEMTEAATNTNIIAKGGEVRFVIDENGDGVIQNGEYIRYALTNDGSNGTNDSSRDGVANAFPCSLGREYGLSPGGGLQPVADNVQAVEFFYHLADGTTSLNPASPEDIRSIDISLLIRTGNKMKKYKDTSTYYPASNADRSETGEKWGPFNDNYKRRIIIANVKCRNLGLNTGS